VSKKRCPKCGLLKDTSEFYHRSYNKDILRSWCKDCEKKSAIEYRHKTGRTKPKITNVMVDKFVKDSNWLFREYHINKKSTRQIADFVGCHRSCIRYWLRKFGIASREVGCTEGKEKERYSKELISKELQKYNYFLKSIEIDKYSHKIITFICNRGHEVTQRLDSWYRSKYKCKECWIEDLSGENSKFWKSYPKDSFKQFKLYRARVLQLTKQNIKKYINYINPSKLPLGKNKYNIDHIYSVYEGFINKVSPEIISSPINLQVLWYSDNIKKSSTSWMSIEELYRRYESWRGD